MDDDEVRPNVPDDREGLPDEPPLDENLIQCRLGWVTCCPYRSCERAGVCQAWKLP